LLQSVGDGIDGSAAIHIVQIAGIAALTQWDFAECVMPAY